MKKLNKKGFSAVELVLLLVLVLAIAGVGYYIYKAKKNTDSAYNNAANAQTITKQTTTKPKTTATNTITDTNRNVDYLVIKEWGVKFKLPSNLTSMSYEVHGNLVYLGATQLEALASTCTVQDMALGNLQRATDTSAFNPAQKTIKIGNYYYGYNNPQSSCTDSNHADAANMQVSVENQLRDSLLPQTLVAN